MTTPHDLLLFDLDGTLSDPEVGITRSMNHALSHFGYAQIDSARVAIYIGPPLDQAFRAITGSSSSAHIEALVAKYRERYAEAGYAENSVYPGIREALATLGATGITMGVCTSKRRDFAERILEMFGLRSYFSFVDGGDIGVHKWLQIEALRTRGAVTGKTVMIGDRAVDLAAAQRNGLRSAGVLWGYGSRAELEKEKPDYLFSAPPELASLAGKSVYNVAAAITAVNEGRLPEWVQTYLRSGAWKNLGLADGLLLAPRWWLGPVRVRLDLLTRKCGPEPEMEYPVPAEAWDNHTGQMAASISDPEGLPPLLVEPRDGKWLITDGNHRHEALRRRGCESFWVIAWMNSENEFNAARASLGW